MMDCYLLHDLLSQLATHNSFLASHVRVRTPNDVILRITYIMSKLDFVYSKCIYYGLRKAQRKYVISLKSRERFLEATMTFIDSYLYVFVDPTLGSNQNAMPDRHLGYL